MKKFFRWLGGADGELEKCRIALGVAREIADNYKTLAHNSERQVIELIEELERLKSDHAKLKEEREQDKRCHAKLAEALGSRVTQPKLNR